MVVINDKNVLWIHQAQSLLCFVWIAPASQRCNGVSCKRHWRERLPPEDCFRFQRAMANDDAIGVTRQI
jgi:hypothetical protein